MQHAEYDHRGPLQLDIPMELLMFLVERREKLVTREEIAERLWGSDDFLDIEDSINTAARNCGAL